MWFFEKEVCRKELVLVLNEDFFGDRVVFHGFSQYLVCVFSLFRTFYTVGACMDYLGPRSPESFIVLYNEWKYFTAYLFISPKHAPQLFVWTNVELWLLISL